MNLLALGIAILLGTISLIVFLLIIKEDREKIRDQLRIVGDQNRGAIAPEVMHRLHLAYGVVLLTLFALSVYLLSRY